MPTDPSSAASIGSSLAPTSSLKLRLPPGVGEVIRMGLVLCALVVVFGFVTDRFLTARTLSAVLQQVPALMIAAVGMTFVMIIGGIDLSVGSLLGFSGATLGVAMVGANAPVAVAVTAAVGTGFALGTINGLVMVQWRLPSFIVTLGMLEIARGGTYLLTNSRTQYIGAAIEPISEAAILGIPLPFILALLIVIAGQVVLSRTVFGRYLIAIGTNEEAVRLSGINTRRLRVATFSLMGALVGVAAVIQTSRLAAADPNAGLGFELQTIAAVVIGGTSLMGGRGTVVGSLLGVLIIAVLDTGLAQVGAAEPAKRLITGLVIVVAVIFDNLRHRSARG